MLNHFRRGASNIFVKGFLGLIALSFVLWGVGDIFHGTVDNDVAKVGGSAVSKAEFDHAMRLEVGKLQQRFGGELTPEQIKAIKLEEVILNQLIDRKLLALAVDKMGIRVGDPAVLENIHANPDFQNEKGQFDKKIFTSLLQANGLNEASYVALLKKEIASEFLLGTLVAEKIIPVQLVDKMYRYRMEKRRVDVVQVPHNHKVEIPALKEAELKPFYEEHKEQFMAPEQRSVAYVTLSVDDLLEGIATSETEARSEYDENIASYQQPERRTVDNLVFADEKQAKDAWEKLKSNRDFAAKAKEITGIAEKDRLLVKVTKTDLPVEVQNNVFELEKGKVSQPVQTSLGWHLFRVIEILPAATEPFDKVQEAITKALTRKKAENSLVDYAKKLEDEFASGASLEEVAKKFGLKLHKVAKLTNKGEGEDGKKIEGLPVLANFLPLVFSSQENNDPVLTLSPDNSSYFVLRVDKVTAPRVRTLEEAKPMVIEAWKRDQEKNALIRLADRVNGLLKKGQAGADVARDEQVELLSGQVVARPADVIYGVQQGKLPNGLLKELFTLPQGGVSDVYKTPEGGYVMGVVKEVLAADAAKDKAGVERVQSELGRQFDADITEQYIRYLHKRYPVKIKAASNNVQE